MMDDLMSLLAPPGSGHVLQAPMGNPGGPAAYGQGKLLAFDTDTFENRVLYRGAELVNVPIQAGPDALTYKEGDVVAVQSFAPNRGATTYWIAGRIITPGPGRGVEAIAWMTSELGRAIAAAVFADRVTFDPVDEDGTTDVASEWVDVSWGGVASPGPTIDIDVSASGKAIILSTAKIHTGAGATGWMHFETTDLDGNVELPPTTVGAASVRSQLDAFPSEVTSTGVTVLTGLTPGPHRLTAKYQGINIAGATIAWSSRVLTGIAL